MGDRTREKLREELETLAGSGVPMRELENHLDQCRDRLSEDDYDELWLYGWALVESRAPRLHIDGLLEQISPLDA